MFFAQAFRVVCQHFNNSALGNDTATALLDHPFELSFHRPKPFHTFLNAPKVLAGYGINRFTRLIWLV